MQRDPLQAILGHPLAVHLWSTRGLTIYGASSVPEVADTSEVRRNHWPDIERFEQTTRWLTRQAFLSDCKRRMEEGVGIYTIAERDGPLLGYGYLGLGVEETTYGHVDQKVAWHPGTAVIYGGFVHPSARGRGIHVALQRARLRDALLDHGMQWVVSGVEFGNGAAIASARRAGLVPLAVLHTRRRLGTTRKAHDVLRPDAPIAKIEGE